MNLDTYQRLQSEGGKVLLAERACFRLTGADRVRYLNGQVTNDVRTASDQQSLYACVTDIKGRIVGDVFIHACDEALWLDAEPGLREVLGPRLERYIIADDAELTDVTEDWQVWHIFGPAMALVRGERVIRSDRLGLPGVDVWLPTGSPPPLSQVEILSIEDFEALRILRGIPRWPRELNAETFPPEAGLENRAMSYTKGCYIGQEILSRIRTTGKMPRTLLLWEADNRVEVGDELFLEGKAVGIVTTASQSPTSAAGSIGLAMIKQAASTSDSILLAGKGAPNIAVRVRTLPPFFA